ncbi:MAG TPA: LamG domain-containing protein, partial [Thermoanaerobaculia bacterium]|nr:LamG domain-containing protein [Thermoanaerobaculia bacterium]
MRRNILLSIVAVMLVLAGAAQAQPFGAWVTLSGPTHGYIQIPSHPSLNPTNAFTFEAWVAISNSAASEDCRSIAGKGYVQTWWLGQCTVLGQPTLRSYLKGGSSARNGGVIPRGVWTHIAVTYDGAKRRHYINGELAAEFNETGSLPTNGEPMRIGSDVNWTNTPAGAIDEVRLWNVARSIAQIRANLNERITTAQPGLVAVWTLDGSG